MTITLAHPDYGQSILALFTIAGRKSVKQLLFNPSQRIESDWDYALIVGSFAFVLVRK